MESSGLIGLLFTGAMSCYAVSCVEALKEKNRQQNATQIPPVEKGIERDSERR